MKNMYLNDSAANLQLISQSQNVKLFNDQNNKQGFKRDF